MPSGLSIRHFVFFLLAESPYHNWMPQVAQQSINPKPFRFQKWCRFDTRKA